MANTDPYVLDYSSCVFVPTKSCSEVLVCLDPIWAERTVSGYAFVYATIKESGRHLSAAGGKQRPRYENVRRTDQYQYSLTINPADFKDSPLAGHPFRLTCKDIKTLFPYTCVARRLTDAIESIDVTGGGDCTWTVNAGTTAAASDASLGTAEMSCGETLHFWSDDGTIDFNVSEGSAIVEASLSASLQAAINNNTTNSSINATNIATNTANITANNTAIVSNTAATIANAATAAMNTTAIATNTTNISTNTTAIATNTTDIATNTTAIATNTTDIATNTASIIANAAASAANTAAIAALVIPNSLADLSDVDFTTAPTTGDFLSFDGTNFVPVSAPTGGGGGFTGTANRLVVTDGSGSLNTSDWAYTANNLIPQVTQSYDIGSPSNRVDTVYSEDFSAIGFVNTPVLQNASGSLFVWGSGLTQMGVSGIPTWEYVVANGTYQPVNDVSSDLGSPSRIIRRSYTREVYVTGFVETPRVTTQASGLDLVIDSHVGDTIFNKNGIEAWRFSTLLGHFLPGTDDSRDIGSAGLRVRNIYTNGPVTTFTGAHIYEIDQKTNTPKAGDLVVLVDRKLQVCTEADSKRAIGIMVDKIYEPSSKEVMVDSFGKKFKNKESLLTSVAAVGDSKASGLVGAKLSNEGGEIEDGDLLTSASKPGFLKKQDDDIVRAKTVAQARETVEFDENGEAKEAYIYFVK